MTPSSELSRHAFRLDLGGTVLELRCPTERLARGFERWFDRPSSPERPHAVLDLEVVAEHHDADLPTSLLTTKTLRPDGGFDVAGGLITGFWDRQTGRGAIRARQLLFESPLIRVLEQIFYQAFYSARARSGRDAVLIHSSGVIARGDGFLFVGPSEAGKSTAAKCSTGHHILGDEMQLLQWNGEGLTLEGTGFNGLFRDKQPGRALLKAVFLLDHQPEHGIRNVREIEAVTSIGREIVPPVGLDEMPDEHTLPAMVDAAQRILQSVPVRCLEFRPDPGFWPLILSAFGPEAEPGPPAP